MVGGNGKDYRLTKQGFNGFVNLLKKVANCKHLSDASTSRILKKKKNSGSKLNSSPITSKDKFLSLILHHEC